MNPRTSLSGLLTALGHPLTPLQPPSEEPPAQQIERELREHRARAAQHHAEREVRERRRLRREPG